MPEKKPVNCARPTGGVVGELSPKPDAKQVDPKQEKGAKNMIQIGKKAPDFSAPAYVNGDFGAVQLSEYLGKWVSLCFYPGDFTFV